MQYDVIIIGSGPAGIGAGIYAKRAMLNCLVIERTAMGGGQIVDAGEVDNYPGLPGLSGFDLAHTLREHANKLEVPFKKAEVTEVRRLKAEDFSEVKVSKEECSKENPADDERLAEKCCEGFAIITKKGEKLLTKTVVIATGASHRLLGVPGEKELTGSGVSYCATCDGAFYRDKVVAVVGGGDTALTDALYLARFVERVYLIHRRAEFRGSKSLQEQVLTNEKITFLPETTVTEIEGDMQVTGLKLASTNPERAVAYESLPVQGIFIAVGMVPVTAYLGDLGGRDAGGYLQAGEDCVTDVPGLFAAGDVRSKKLRQVITAVADGAAAIESVEEYLRR